MQYKFYLIFLITFFSVSTAYSQSYIINDYAGDNYTTGGFSGDGGAATSAETYMNSHIATDKAGNLYIPDEFNNRIRKVTRSTGKINTIAGTGVSGIKGDGGPADSAQLVQPSSIAVDDSGNIYIASHLGSHVQKISKTTGIITTVAGKVGATKRGDGGPAIKAALGGVYAIALDDSANIYILSSSYGVRKVTKKTGIITTIAGGDTSGRPGSSADGCHADTCLLKISKGITLDKEGNLYIAETNNHSVRKVTKSTGILSTVVGSGKAGYSGDGGLAVSAELNAPSDVAFDKKGNLLIADSYNGRIRQVNLKGNATISTIAGNGVSTYCAGDGGLADSACIGTPLSVCCDTFGNIFIQGCFSVRVLAISTGVSEVTTKNEELRIYPNPNNGVFTVNYTMSLNTKMATLSISNVMGNAIKTYNVPVYNTKASINNLGLPQGLYIGQLYADGQLKGTTRIVIVK